MRVGAREVQPVKADRHKPALINTCVYNRKKRTHTLYAIALDLDAHRADARWKHKTKGHLKWPEIRKFLQEEHPKLWSFVFAAVRSTGGQGIALWIAISPMELAPSTAKNQSAALYLLRKLIYVLNEAGLGADEAAAGLKRDFCNWRVAEPTIEERVGKKPKVTRASARSLFLHEPLLHAVHCDGTPVVTHLLEEYRGIRIPGDGGKKRNADAYLWPQRNVERKLIPLYDDLWEACATPVGGSSFTKGQLAASYELSPELVAKLLRHPPAWLKVERLDAKRGWMLRLNSSKEIDQRVEALKALEKAEYEANIDLSGPLPRPEAVVDGMRNDWITRATLTLKHHGIACEDAVALMQGHVQRIPGHEKSRNCKAVKQIVRSIYRGHSGYRGVRPGCAPLWLLQGLSKLPTPQLSNPSTEGGRSPVACALRPPAPAFPDLAVAPKLCKVSMDQCFAYERNFYSVPRPRDGYVQVFDYAGKLKIYALDGKYLCTHLKSKRDKGFYTAPHVSPLDHWLCDWLLWRYRQMGNWIGEFVKPYVSRHGALALRRLWMLDSLIKTYGATLINRLAASHSTLRTLTHSLKLYPKLEAEPPAASAGLV